MDAELQGEYKLRVPDRPLLMVLKTLLTIPGACAIWQRSLCTHSAKLEWITCAFAHACASVLLPVYLHCQTGK